MGFLKFLGTRVGILAIKVIAGLLIAFAGIRLGDFIADHPWMGFALIGVIIVAVYTLYCYNDYMNGREP
jgi:hypothetical protein